MIGITAKMVGISVLVSIITVGIAAYIAWNCVPQRAKKVLEWM